MRYFIFVLAAVFFPVSVRVCSKALSGISSLHVYAMSDVSFSTRRMVSMASHRTGRVITVLSSTANQFLLQAKVRQRYSDDDACCCLFCQS